MERNIALLIDFENIAAGTEKEGLGKFDIDKVVARIKDKGRILIARSYGDWGRFARFKQGLLAANVTMYELTSHGMQDKNRADIAMVVDCLELAYTRDYIDTFVVVSGDSDFTPLVLKLRELNKSVIGIGTRKSTSRLLINACDEFVFYDTMVQTKARIPAGSSEGLNRSQVDAAQLLVEALQGMLREDPTPPHASVLKSVLLRRLPDFSEEDLGFPSFTRYVESLEKAGFVALSKDPKSGGWRVDLAAGVVAQVESSTGPAAAFAPAATSEDTYLPAGSEDLVKRLHQEALGPLSAPARMAALEAIVEFVGRRRRRVPPGLVADELPKRLRRTFPFVTAKTVRGVLKGLLMAGRLMHKEGDPVRQATVPFMVTEDAAALNKSLVEVYLKTLHRSGADLSNTAMLAEFLYGDAARNREVEEVLAWQVQDTSEGDLDAFLLTDGEEGAEVVDDLDDALFVEDGDDAPAAPKAAAKKPEPKATKEASKKPEPKAKKAVSADAPSTVEAEAPSEAAASAKKPSRARKPKAKVEPADEGDALDAMLQLED